MGDPSVYFKKLYGPQIQGHLSNFSKEAESLIKKPKFKSVLSLVKSLSFTFTFSQIFLTTNTYPQPFYPLATLVPTNYSLWYHSELIVFHLSIIIQKVVCLSTSPIYIVSLSLSLSILIYQNMVKMNIKHPTSKYPIHPNTFRDSKAFHIASEASTILLGHGSINYHDYHTPLWSYTHQPP